MRVSFNPIRNLQLPSLREFSDELLGTDLYERNFDGQWSGNDDYQTVSGLPNLKQAIYHRLITNPGELFAHPEYGCGIEEYVSAPMDRHMKAELMSRIKNNLLMEVRIARIVYIRINTGDSNTPIGTVEIQIGLIPINTNKEQAFHYAISERDWLLRDQRGGNTYYVDMAKQREYKERGIALE